MITITLIIITWSNDEAWSFQNKCETGLYTATQAAPKLIYIL